MEVRVLERESERDWGKKWVNWGRLKVKYALL